MRALLLGTLYRFTELTTIFSVHSTFLFNSVKMKFSTLALTAAVPALAAVVPASIDTTEIVPTSLPASVDTSVDTVEGICPFYERGLPVLNIVPSQARQLQVDP